MSQVSCLLFSRSENGARRSATQEAGGGGGRGAGMMSCCLLSPMHRRCRCGDPCISYDRGEERRESASGKAITVRPREGGGSTPNEKNTLRGTSHLAYRGLDAGWLDAETLRDLEQLLETRYLRQVRQELQHLRRQARREEEQRQLTLANS
eukprot:scaffold21778_cov131-Isochrysis_galbana.AAC.4